MINRLMELIYPTFISCVSCEAQDENAFATGLCKGCKSELGAHPFKEEIMQGKLPYVFCFYYHEKIKEMIHDFKYNDKRYYDKVFALCLSDAMVELNLTDFDYFIPVPMHKKRKRLRGYNQCQLLVKELNKIYKKKPCNCIIKIKDTVSQTALSGTQRLTNVKDSFGFDDRFSIDGKTIVLVDDVITTGSTAKECAKLLYKHGAKKVVGLFVAGVEK